MSNIIERVHAEFAPFMYYEWEEVWAKIRVEATSDSDFTVLALLSNISIDRIRYCIDTDKGPIDQDAIVRSLGFHIDGHQAMLMCSELAILKTIVEENEGR
jgi:hypothetical protein